MSNTITILKGRRSQYGEGKVHYWDPLMQETLCEVRLRGSVREGYIRHLTCKVCIDKVTKGALPSSV